MTYREVPGSLVATLQVGVAPPASCECHVQSVQTGECVLVLTSNGCPLHAPLRWTRAEMRRVLACGDHVVALDNCECIRESDRALLVRFSVSDTPQVVDLNAAAVSLSSTVRSKWVPRSQILPESAIKQKGDKGCLLITAWLARQDEDSVYLEKGRLISTKGTV